jgi:branched-chain amino acid transport system ATP-binding protein
MAKAVLETTNLTKAFGGLVAVDDVNFKLNEGELRGIIGPNGAGKTTLFYLVIGYLKPTSGKIFFYGKDITGLPPHVISQMGIASTFQLTNIFPGMTVLENIWVGVHSRSKRRWHPFIQARSLTTTTSRAEELCKLVGLGDKMNEVAANLSHGDRRLLEIAIALSSDPTLLLLDEPTAGMSPKEAENVVEVIGKLSQTKTIILIEHNVDVVLRLAETITVLDKGRVIAEGPPDEISANEDVQRIYLGVE